MTLPFYAREAQTPGMTIAGKKKERDKKGKHFVSLKNAALYRLMRRSNDTYVATGSRTKSKRGIGREEEESETLVRR